MYDRLLASRENPVLLATLSNVVERVTPTSTPAEAMWLYQRTLEAISMSAGEPALKLLALQVGRIAHGKARPDGRVTVYDEQAMANDIAARIR
jgi:hypothetical protein